MKSSESSEAFTHYVIKQIKPEIRNSLTEIQFQEIKNAIAASSPLKKHAVDIRGVVPLFFSRFYFVVLLGRDRRKKIKQLEKNRRCEGDLLTSILFFIVFILPMLFVVFLILYIIKSELGIDIFPDAHLSDFLYNNI